MVVTDRNLDMFEELVEPEFGASTELCTVYAAVRSKVQAQAVIVEKGCWVRLSDGRLLQALSTHMHHQKVAGVSAWTRTPATRPWCGCPS